MVRDEDLPRFRGALHLWALGPFLIASGFLLAYAGDAAFWPILAYVFSVCGLLGTSALYHRVDWSERWYQWIRRIDHSMIFVLIVGTWTPLCLVACAEREMGLLYAALCVAAALGVIVTLAWTGAPKWVRASVYLAVGWMGAFAVPDILASVGMGGLGMLALGGVLYSLGAVVYAFKFPDPFPRTFGYHEIFHALVVLAAAAHMSLVGFWVVA